MERKEKNITSVSFKQQYSEHPTNVNEGPSLKFRDFSKELIEQIYNQARPHREQIQNAVTVSLHDDPQPCSSNQKFRAARVHRDEDKGKIQNKKSFHKKPRNIHRMSFESRLQDKREKLESSGLMKFPSQKTLLSKQKVLPVSSHEREKYVIQIYRIMKQNQSTAMAENSKQLQAFRQHQKQKYMKCIQQKKKKKDETPFIAINYDGSIMNVQPLKKTLNQFIECTGQIIEDQRVESINDKKRDKNKKIDDKLEQNFDKIEEIQSQYIGNFSRINWNPKITVYNNWKLKQGNKQGKPSRKTSTIQQQLRQKYQHYHNRSRAHTVSITKASNDDKSTVKIYNANAYQEHLMTKPTHVNGKRSYTSSQITEDIKFIMDQNANREEIEAIKCRPGTAGCFNRTNNNNNVDKSNVHVSNKQKLVQVLGDEDVIFDSATQKNNSNKGVVGRCKSAHYNLNNKRPQESQQIQIKISHPNHLTPSSVNTSTIYNKQNINSVGKQGKQFLKKFQSQKNSFQSQVKKKTKIRDNVKAY